MVRIIKNGTCIEKGYKYDFVGLRVLDEIVQTIYIDTVSNTFVVIVVE